MALNEKLAFLVTLDAKGAIKGFSDIGNEADKNLKKADSGLDKVGGNLTKFGAGAVAAAGIAGIALFKAGQSASDLGESINAVNVTFGEAAAGVLELGENAASTVGLSNTAFNSLAVQFSSFADTIAGKGGDVVGTIDQMSKRAADFASVMNIDVKEAATIFQSGLAGETEPLKKFGIDLSAATVEAYALANGIGTAGKQLSETEKIQARYGLLLEKTAKTQGDFANTADSAANAQRIAAAEIENAMASLGKSVAPVMAKIATAVGGVAKAFSAANEATDGWLGTAAGITTIGVGVAGTLSVIAGQAIKMRSSFIDAEGALTGFGKTAKTVGQLAVILAVAEAASESAGVGMQEDFSKTTASIDELREQARGLGIDTNGWEYAVISGEKTLADFQAQIDATKTDDLATGMGKAATAAIAAGAAIELGAENVGELAGAVTQLDTALKPMVRTTDIASGSISELGSGVSELDAGLEPLRRATDIATGSIAGLETAVGELAPQFKPLDRNAHDAAVSVQELTDTITGMRDEINGERTVLQLAQDFDDLKESGAEAMKAVADGSMTAEEAQRQQRLRTLELKDAVVSYAEEIGGIPPEKLTEIQALIDQGKLDEAEWILAQLARDREVALKVKVKGNIGADDSIIKQLFGGDDGGVVPGPRGSEQLIVAHGGETLIPTHKVPLPNRPVMVGTQTSGGDTYNIISGLDERRVTALLRRNARRGGRNPWG